ncbi:unnamed protein product [Victoria cruziana]
MRFCCTRSLLCFAVAHRPLLSLSRSGRTLAAVAMPTSFDDPPPSSSPFSASPNLNRPDLLDPSAGTAGADFGGIQVGGSAPGPEGVLADPASNGNDAEFGFYRPDMYKGSLVGTVDMYERHVFLCYKTAESWPPRIEASEFDRLPRTFAAALKARSGSMPRKTRLTICEGRDGTETSNGDVLIFPDMIRYRSLTHFDVDSFVEDVLVKDTDWISGTPEALTGSYVFVCAHGSRDRRCGVCGPPLIKKFKDEIEAHGLKGQISVSPCSHIGGHKYAGNVIIFGASVGGVITGHWYGYVTLDDVSLLLNQHIGKGEIVDRLWRGQMGLSEEEQKRSQEQRLQLNGEAVPVDGTASEKTARESEIVTESTSYKGVMGCCGGSGGGFTCCQDVGRTEGNGGVDVKKKSGGEDATPASNKCASAKSKMWSCSLPSWFETWEKEDTFAALAIVGAVASVAVAYSFYRRSN